jgi:hypothetical protein
VLPKIIVVWIVASIVIAFFGSKLRFGFWGYLFASLLLSPILGFLLLAAAIPPKASKAAGPPRRD